MAELNSKGKGRLLRIFIGEHERTRGKSLSDVIVLKARELGLAGATVVRGQSGFGAGSRVEGKRDLALSKDDTLVIEILDHPERIAECIGEISGLVTQGLIVVEDVDVIKYTSRV